jgi:beta-glucosidase
MDPVFFGKYPEQGVEAFGKSAPKVTDSDMKIISQELDFLGINVYTGSAVKAGADGKAQIVMNPAGYQMNTYDWPIVPDVLYWAGKFFYERYKKPLVITENGTAVSEIIARDGHVPDPQRSEFIAKHLIQMDRAIQDGVPYKGYFYWSLLDNFEWHWGYKHRFGLVYVDFETGERIIKDSARFYGDIIAGKIELKA